MQYLVLDPPQPDYDSMTFDYDRDPALVARWSKLADAKDPDLSKFRKSGGKLIMTYGWADQILQPMMGVNYYEAVVAKNGNDTPDFVAPVHDARHGALRRRRRPRSQRCRDGGHRLGGEGQGAGFSCSPARSRTGRSSARGRCARTRRSRATRGRAASTRRRTSLRRAALAQQVSGDVKSIVAGECMGEIARGPSVAAARHR